MNLEKILNNNNRFIKWGKYRMRGRKAQLMLLASITISVSIVLMSLVAVSLSNIGIETFQKKQSHIFERYRNVRDIFLYACSSAVYNMSYLSDDDIYRVVNTTRDGISMMESRYGYNFYAEVRGIERNINVKPQNVYLDIHTRFSSGESWIDEDLVYHIWSGSY